MIIHDSNRIEIETEDAVSFSLTLASPVSRALAIAIDLAVLVVIQSIINAALFIPFQFLREFAVAITTVLFFATNFGYFVLLEYAWKGQTIGKRLLKLQVMDAHIQKLNGYQILLRNLFRVVDMLPLFYTLGGIVAICNRKYQRLGDIAASTIVIRLQQPMVPHYTQAISNQLNSFRRYPHIEAILKRNSHPEEHLLAFETLQRRNQLDASARVELFDSLAHHFKAKAKFPPEATDHLTNEQYIRNCIDSLYRQSSTKSASAADSVRSR